MLYTVPELQFPAAFIYPECSENVCQPMGDFGTLEGRNLGTQKNTGSFHLVTTIGIGNLVIK